MTSAFSTSPSDYSVPPSVQLFHPAGNELSHKLVHTVKIATSADPVDLLDLLHSSCETHPSI